MKKLLFIIMLCSGFVMLNAETFTPKKPIIVLAEKSGSLQRFAATELQKHLRLVTGAEIAIAAQVPGGSYPFYIGQIPADDTKPLIREEARWRVTPQGAWFYGEDFNPGRNKREDVFNRHARTGTLTAVYDFLEKQFKIRWLEPGDGGIAYTAGPLDLTIASGAWNPGPLEQRFMRCWILNSWINYQKRVPEMIQGLTMNQAEYNRFCENTYTWFRRQRLGNGIRLHYGHAFTQWWQLYGKEHLEYFAMQEDGVRRPIKPNLPKWSKLCVSNPAVAKQIVANWLAENPRSETVNVCENDSGGYCRCDECRKLDAPMPGEAFDAHLTDRYVYLANTVQKLATEHDPNVSVVMYAYACYRQPPRKIKVDPRVIIGFVPSMLELQKVDAMYKGWREAGAVKLFLRPNDQHVNTGLPMGFEKQLFEHFQLGIRNGIIGTDYDSSYGYWPITGIADYILARAHTDPSQSFEHWEKEYYAGYGAAADLMAEYWRYWRKNIWEERLLPNAAAIRERGRYGNFRRGIMWDLDKYYRLEDFDKTDAILQQAAQLQLTPDVRRRIEQIQLVGQHSRLMFAALTAPAKDKLIHSKALLAFRIKHKDDLNINWTVMQLKAEKPLGDITGVFEAEKFLDFSDFRPLPIIWQFKIDPENQGVAGQWEKTQQSEIRKEWSPIMVNRFWEDQAATKGMPQALKDQLKNYDGIGYYGHDFSVPKEWEGNEIYLFFGAVDESAWIYLNGQSAGEHIYKAPNDWQTPFTIRIDHLIDWKRSKQLAIVRVEDKAGSGGIWKPVYVVKK